MSNRDERGEVGAPGDAYGAWRSWLGALGTDAEAALSAALTYESFSPEARAAWLDALATDAPQVRVKRLALYGPLLAVENDPARRARIFGALSTTGEAGAAPSPRRALRSIGSSAELVCVVVRPMYLDFVEALVCRYHPDRGIFQAFHDPLQNARVFAPACEVDGVTMANADVSEVVEELAHAVLADRREGRNAPPALVRFADLFQVSAR